MSRSSEVSGLLSVGCQMVPDSGPKQKVQTSIALCRYKQ